MMQLTARMVRSYKGAAASILLLFIAEGFRPLSQGEMRRGTGYGDDVINDAVWMLREDGLITEAQRYTWCFTGGAQQLPIGAAGLPEECDSELSTPPVDNSADFTDLGPTGSDLAMNESMIPLTLIEDDSLIHSSSSEKIGAAPPSPAGVTRADLTGFGFYGRGLENMLKMPGLTLREVAYHVQHAPSLGAAMTRILKPQPVPREYHYQPPLPAEEAPETDGDPPGEDPPDEEAQAWWAAIVAGLREQVPKVTFESIFPRGAPAWRAGDALEVHVPNRAFLEHVDAGELARLAMQVSRGAVQTVRFITE